MRALAVVFVLAACPPAIPPLPSQGGPKWVELQSDDFTVWTDDAPAHARELVARMERMRQIVYGTAFPTAHTTTRTLVVAFRNAKEMHAYVVGQFGAQSFPLPNVLDQPAIIVAADELGSRSEVLVHELAHVISFHVLPAQPHWFAEGLATYFETVRLDESSGTLDIGVPSAGRMRQLRAERPLPIAELFACNELRCLDGRFYATAWAFFSFLVSEHPRELVAYMQRMPGVPREGLTALWTEMFPQLAPGTVDHELARWLAHGRSIVKKFTVERREWAVAQRDLGDADVHAARGLARYLTHRRETAVSPEIVAALAADPTHVIARVVEYSYKRAIARDLARTIVAAHPDDWRAWWLAWRAGDRDAHESMCAKIARDPPVGADKLCPPTPP